MARTRGAVPVLVLFALAVCAVPASARDDEVDFALKLADRGYEGLAQKVVDRMVAGSPTPEKKGGAEFARCELLRRTALIAASDEKNPPPEVRAKFNAAAKAYEGFLKSYPGHPRKSDAEFNRVKLNTDFAYYLQKNLDRFPANEREGVLKEANKISDDAITDLTRIKEREDEELRKQPDDPAAVDAEDRAFQRNLAWYNLCVALHDRAMLLPPGDALRTQHFTRATEETKLLLEETDGLIFGYYASMYLGLCFWHRGDQGKSFDKDDVKQAAEWFGTVISAAESYQDLDNAWPSCAKVVLQATARFGEMCNAVGVLEGKDYRKILVDTVGRIEARLPSTRTDRFGLQAVIEKGRAQSGLGRHEAAVDTLNRASASALAADPAWGRAVDQIAKRGLNDVIAAIPPDANIRVPPAVLFKAAEGSLRDGSFGRAVRVYQRVLLAVEAEPEAGRRRALSGEYSAKCWTQINECYMSMERYLEAFHAANVPVQQYLAAGRNDEDQDIDDLAFYRITALQALAQKAPPDQKAAALSAVDEARKLFTEKFASWSDKGQSTTYGVALARLSQAQSLRGSGDAERAAAAYRDAIENFRKIGDKDNFFRNAQSRIGEALVSGGRTDEGLRHLQDFVRKNTEFWKDANTPARERQSWGWALFWIATAHNNQRQYAKVVETLEGFEAAFEGASLGTTYPRVRYLRTSALKEAGRGEEAEKVARLMIKESPDSGWTPQAALLAANDLQARGARASQAGDRKAAADLRKRALELYDFWIERSPGITADNYTFVGQLHDWAGDGEKAAEHWSKALRMYEDAGDEDDSEKIKVFLSGLLVSQGKYAQALPQFEDLFVKAPESVEPIRDLFRALLLIPSKVEPGVHREKVRKELGRMADMLAKDPVGAPLASEARRAASGAGTETETEMMIRVFADKPEQRRALARATAFTVLGEDANLVAEVKVAAFGLVKRSPDLMSNLARCYEELWLTEAEYGIRALNLYGTLLESAPPLEVDKDTPGSRYTERWFDWKFRMTRLYLNIGLKYQNAPALRTVCGILRSMDTVEELVRADKVRENFKKEFLSLKDQADAALRKMSQEGCK